jgi:hypothetical protein
MNTCARFLEVFILKQLQLNIILGGNLDISRLSGGSLDGGPTSRFVQELPDNRLTPTGFWYSFHDQMAQSQATQIKELEESLRQLLQQNAEMREMAETVKDQDLRETLLKAAMECEEAVRNLTHGLRAMRENLQ